MRNIHFYTLCCLCLLFSHLLTACGEDSPITEETSKENNDWAPSSLDGHELFFYYNNNKELILKMLAQNGEPVFYVTYASQILNHPTPSYFYKKIDEKTAELEFHVLFISITGDPGYYFAKGKLNFTSPTEGLFIGMKNDETGELALKIEVKFTMDKEYSNEQTKKPELSACTIVETTATTATLNATIACEQASLLTETGFCWGTAPQPVKDKNSLKCEQENRIFSANIEGLSPATTYYARAYAVYDNHIYYGEETTFRTKKEEMPPTEFLFNITGVSTGFSYYVNKNLIRIDWTFTGKSLNDFKEIGICWGEKSNPTIKDNSQVAELKDNGRITIDDIKEAADYHVRLYCITKNNKIIYGEDYPCQTIGKDIILSAKFGKTYTDIYYEIKNEQVYTLQMKVLRWNLQTESATYNEALKKGKGSARIYLCPNNEKESADILLQDKLSNNSFFINGLKR